jgi:TrmH family RNA methyltransferase
VTGGSAVDLSNPRSERVRSVRRLSGRAARRRTGLFLAEGPAAARELAVGAALDVYLTASAADRHPDLRSAALHRGARVFSCTDEVLAAMSDTVSPQGVVAVCRSISLPLDDVLAARPRTIAVLANVRDPGNAGTVIRAADASGTGAVVFTSASVDPFNPKCVRSTTGSVFHVDLCVDADLSDLLTTVRRAGYRVLAADGRGDLDLDDLTDLADTATGPLTGPVVWLFGNEAWGLADEHRRLADDVVRVPIHGRAESLNLAMAATVCLYASARANRRARPDTPRPPTPLRPPGG